MLRFRSILEKLEESVGLAVGGMLYGTVATETALTQQWGLRALVKQVGTYGWVAEILWLGLSSRRDVEVSKLG